MRKFLGMVMTGVGLVAGACADEIKLSDTFIDASNWNLNQDWRLTDDGQMAGTKGGGSFLFLKEQKMSGDLSFEADVTPIEAKNPSWKVCGLTIFKDSKNFWALCFVEMPDKDGKKHFVELKEMKDGVWGAETKTAKNILFKNGGLNWSYNTAYRLKLALNGEGVTGTVSDKDGKLLTEIKFQFTGDAVKTGAPALRISGMTTNFDNVEISGK